MQGYEIHMGVTTPVEGTPDSPLNLLENGSTDGYCVDSTCMGTYIHAVSYTHLDVYKRQMLTFSGWKRKEESHSQ